MKILPGSSLSSQVQVIVSHGDDELFFMAGVFTRKAFHSGYDVFEQINHYWESLPYTTQTEIWNIYKDIYQMFEEALTGAELYEFLNKSIQSLIAMHPLDKLELFLAMDPSVQVPDIVEDTFIPNADSSHTRDKTFDRKDYMQLTALSLFLRTMVPIWGHYVFSIRRETGMETKEYVAFQLFIGTGILETPAMQKLEHYINTLTKDKRTTIEKTMDAISSEDMGFMLLALVCIRRLAACDLRGLDSKQQPVAIIYKYMFQKVFNPSERDSFVQEKRYKEANGGGDDQAKRSLLECYRKRTELSIGEIAEINFAFEDVYAIAERLAPGINPALIDQCIQTASMLYNERVGDVQLILLAWLIKPLISPKAVFYLHKERPDGKLVEALAMAEAVFWHYGHKYLSTVVTSHLVIGVEEMSISQFDARMQIPEDLSKQIVQSFPYQWQSRRRKSGIDDIAPDQHPVLLSIDLMMDELTKNAWRKTASEAHIAEAFGRFERKLRLNPETKSDLARLLVDLEHRRKHIKPHPLLA